MLFVLPGMGADHRMYPAPWPSLSDSVFVDWPKFRGEESLTDLAKRLIDEHHIESSAWLAGSSLGGMVACEIATMVSARGLILIGSAKRTAGDVFRQ